MVTMTATIVIDCQTQAEYDNYFTQISADPNVQNLIADQANLRFSFTLVNQIVT